MKAPYFNLKKIIVVGSASVFALLAVPMVSNTVSGGAFPIVATAHAEGGHDGGAGSGHEGSGKGKGGSAQGQQGKGSSHEGGAGGASKSVEGLVTTSEDEGGGTGKGDMNEGGARHDQGQWSDNQMKGSGKGGPGEDSDAKGPRYSDGSSSGSGGGKPVWAQGGIDENVELGRLNSARAPGKVLDRQLTEALTSLTAIVSPDGTSVYEAANLNAALAAIRNDATRVDSPLANLALLKDFLSDGVIDGNYTLTDGTTNMIFDPSMSDGEFVSLLVGSASDKTVPISTGTVEALTTILGVNLPVGVTATQVADDAEAVRVDILYAHDN